MEIWAYIFFALFFGTLIALVAVLNLFTRRISEVERQRAELQIEEERVFAFLHSFGEAFSEGVSSVDLHRLIVEGAARIVDAHGGALYLMDRGEKVIVPAFLSKSCPPLHDVPPHVLDQAETNAMALESYLRLSPVTRGAGILGRAIVEGQPRLFTEADLAEAFPGDSPLMARSAMVAPLVYRRKTLGVLAVANGPSSKAFTAKDLIVFRNIAEQSAFALYNEAVYLEMAEKKRLDHDLEIAREIQSILLPSSPPAFNGYDLSGVNVPARQVSGDYYDYVAVDDRHLGVVIADVSGKGVPASLIMAMCRSVLRGVAFGRTSAAEVLGCVNQQLYPDIKEDMFISMAYLIIDSQTGQASLARAGHDAPLLFRSKTGEVEKLSPKGMALGIDSGDVFNRICRDYPIDLESGDCLLLYTDGATEALNIDGAEFGLARLVESLRESAPQGAAAVIRKVTSDVKAFVAHYPQHDDITLIALRRK